MIKTEINKLKKNKFSLVLSGGSALGFAHLGILKFLEENDLVPDEIIGTSFGALAGAFLAQGHKYQELLDIVTHLSFRKLISIKYGSNGLQNKKIYDYLKKLYDNQKFNDAKIPLNVVATDFLSGKSFCFSKKDNSNLQVVDAVMASISIPGIFSPKKIQENYYVDGFLSSNLPVEYAKKGNLILAIDVNNFSTIIDFRKRKKRLFRRTKEVMGTLSNTFNWMIVNQTREKILDLEREKRKYILVEPDLHEFTKLDFKKGKIISDKGYVEICKYFQK